MGGRSVDFPEPTAEERELQQEQISILRSQQQLVAEQSRVQDLVAPFLLSRRGSFLSLMTQGKLLGLNVKR